MHINIVTKFIKLQITFAVLRAVPSRYSPWLFDEHSQYVRVHALRDKGTIVHFKKSEFSTRVKNARHSPPNGIFRTSGFWPRVRARALRTPVFLGSLTCKTGRCAPPPRPSHLRSLVSLIIIMKHKVYSRVPKLT